MPVSVHCPRCSQPVSIPDRAAGKRVKCPQCQGAFLAPGLTDSVNNDDDWLQIDDPPVARRSGESPSSPGETLLESEDDPLFDDLRQEEDEFTAQVESPPQPKPATSEATEIEYATEYRVKCKICDSLMFAKASQAGKTVKCSDCHSPMTIPQPPKVNKKPSIDIASAPTFNLEPPKTVRDRHDDPHRKSAAQLLEEAARVEQEESAPIRYADTPNVREWLAGIFGIFRDPSVVTHWFGLSMIAAVPIMVVMSIDHPYMYAMLLPGSLFFGAVVVSCGFAILQSVANGEERVSEWPLFDPPSWLGELMVAIAAAGMVAAPVATVTTILDAGLVGVAITMFAIYALFPFVLLSMMDMNSVLQPFSPEVARSVTKCEEAWGGLYFSSGILFAVLFLLIVSTWSMGAAGIAICVLASVAAAFIYFAMIGRLAYAIGQAVNASPRTDDPESTSTNDS